MMSKPEKEQKDRNGWGQIKHFKPKDFSCRCEGLCEHPTIISMDLVEKLDRMQEVIGEQVTILKGSVCSRYHDRKKGLGPAGPSPHLASGKDGLAYAVDILTPNANFKYRLVAAAIAEGIKGIEVGSGKNYVHLEDSPYQDSTNLWAR